MQTRSMKLAACSATLAFAAFAAQAGAAPVTILNPSFETPDLGSGGASSSGIPSATPGYFWASRGGYYGGAGNIDENVGSTPATPAGDQWAILNVDTTLSGDGGGDSLPDDNVYLWQQIGTVDANGQYTINYLLGLRNASVFEVGDLNVSIWAGGTAPFAANGATLLDNDSSSPLPTANTTLTSSSVLFAGLSNVGQSLWLRFQVTSDFDESDNGFGQLLLDDVSGDMIQTPEPASLALVTLGGALLLRRRR